MNAEDSNMAANAICHAASMVQYSWQDAALELMRPSVVFKPKLSKDGNRRCALFGDDLQVGVAGFGDTPNAAMYDFDKNWDKP
jgi:hypothetical protein